MTQSIYATHCINNLTMIFLVVESREGSYIPIVYNINKIKMKQP